MGFTVGIHFKNGDKDYGNKANDWAAAESLAVKVSLDTTVEMVTLNCGGITQQMFVGGKPRWNINRVRGAYRCPHGNRHK
jgi:hypothetical protein